MKEKGGKKETGNVAAYENLLYSMERGIATVTINRPGRGNTINDPLIADFHRTLDAIERDGEVRAVIVTGGPKVFCAGADLTEIRTPGRTERSNRLFSRIDNLDKPTIAAINGYALGGGLELSLCCDFRVASEDARLGTPEVKVGIIPSGGATLRLTRVVGVAKAKELLLVGDAIGAARALEIGLVHRVATPGTALAEATKLAETLLDRAPLSIKVIKECIRVGMVSDDQAAVGYIIKAADLLRNTEDYAEGRAAFREKRKPVWKGR